MDSGTGARPDEIAETALQREIEAALKKIEIGLNQASAGIVSLQGPLNVMANLLLVTREGRTPTGHQEVPEVEETVPDDQGQPEDKGIFGSDPQVPPLKILKRARDVREQEPPAAEETGHGKEDEFQSQVALDSAAKERLSKIEERLRSLEG